MKSDAKCRKWGCLGYLGVTQGHWKQHQLTECVRVLRSAKLSLCLAPFPTYGVILVENRCTCIRCPCWNDYSNFTEISCIKTRASGLLSGVVCMIICLGILACNGWHKVTAHTTLTVRHAVKMHKHTKEQVNTKAFLKSILKILSCIFRILFKSIDLLPNTGKNVTIPLSTVDWTPAVQVASFTSAFHSPTSVALYKYNTFLVNM